MGATLRRPAVPFRVRAAAPAVAAPVALAVIVAGSAIIRTRALDAPFWVDEGISVGIASHPLAAIPGLLRQDGSPPLYYLILHLWMGLAGRSGVATHTLSLIVALACIPVAWWAARTLWGARAGWAAATLTAVSPPLTEHAQETRMYPLVVLLSLLVAGSFAGCFVARRPRFAWIHAAALTALAYTHNWFLFLAAAEAIALAALIATGRGSRGELVRRGAIAFGVPAVLYLPWVPTLLFQSRHTGAPWSRVPGLANLWQVRDWLLVAPAALTALAIAVATAAIVLRRERRSAELRQLLVLAWLTGGTLVLAWAYSQANPAWASRYTTIVLGPLLLLCALGLSRIGTTGLVATTVVIVAWGHEPPLHQLTHRSNVRAMAARLAPRYLRPGDLVLDALPESVPVLRYYLGPRLRYASSLGPTPDPGVMDWRDAFRRLERARPRALVALVNRLPPGAHVALVRPPQHAHSTTIAWHALSRERANELDRRLLEDPLVRRIRRLHPGFHGGKTTVRADVFVRLRRAVAGTRGGRGSSRGRGRRRPTARRAARA